MAKYKFIKDFSIGTYVPPGSGMPTRRIDFKKDQIVDGNLIRNESQSEPPNFIVVNTSQGSVRIPFGGRAGSILSDCIIQPNCIKSPCPSMDVCSGSERQARPGATTKNNSLFTVKNLIIVVVIILIFLFIKYAWPMIKGSK